MREYFKLTDSRQIYLLQRLEEQTFKGPDQKGIDRFFRLDYMGSAEFEFGAIPTCLKRFRKDEKVLATLKPLQIKFGKDGKHQLSFVGDPALAPKIAKFFDMETASPMTCQLKERTDIQRVYQPESGYQYSSPSRTIGWLDIQNDWAAFKNAKHAHNFIDGLRDAKGIR